MNDTMLPRRAALLLGLALAGLSACSKNEPAASATAPAAVGASPPAGAQTLYAQASAKGSGFGVGPMMAADPVLVFFDPQCPHCAQLWKAALPLAGTLRMVWMPVGFLRNVSEPQGAAILASKDPVGTMTQHEALLEARQGGLAASDAPEAERAKVKANTELLNKLGADSVPFILYRNRRTGEYGTHAGAVGTEQLAAMAGL